MTNPLAKPEQHFHLLKFPVRWQWALSNWLTRLS